MLHRSTGDRIKRAAIIRENSSLHARIPKIADMLRGGGNRRHFPLDREIPGNLIGHIAQSGQVHPPYSAAAVTMRRLFSDQLA